MAGKITAPYCVSRCAACEFFGYADSKRNRGPIAMYVCVSGQSDNYQHLMTSKHKICANCIRKTNPGMKDWLEENI